MYAFINDTNGVSTCTGACAVTWPPLTVTAGWTAGSGNDRANFHTIANGASAELVAGRWPLYRFAGDSRPGDVNGQGLESFYVVRPGGSLFKGTAASDEHPEPHAGDVAAAGTEYVRRSRPNGVPRPCLAHVPIRGARRISCLRARPAFAGTGNSVSSPFRTMCLTRGTRFRACPMRAQGRGRGTRTSDERRGKGRGRRPEDCEKRCLS